jgi:hypothetical protein
MAARKTGGVRPRRGIDQGEVLPPANGDLTMRISQRAYEIFLARGGEHGHDVDDWLEAERQVTGSDRELGRDDIAIAAGAPVAPRQAVATV